MGKIFYQVGIGWDRLGQRLAKTGKVKEGEVRGRNRRIGRGREEIGYICFVPIYPGDV